MPLPLVPLPLVALPFLALQGLALLLCILFPQTILWLPSLVYG